MIEQQKLRPQIVELLEKLVSFDSTSSLSNKDLAIWIQEWLKRWDIQGDVIDGGTPGKFNVFVTMGTKTGNGSKTGHDPTQGVLLSGHMDVVPVRGQQWTSDPFMLDCRDGRYYGRGTSDMKAFIALALDLASRLDQKTMRKNLYLAFTCDEEIGCKGVGHLIEWVKPKLARDTPIIVGEPTSMRVISGHKGLRSFCVEVRGIGAHSSQTDRGVNAIQISARIINFIENLHLKLASGDGYQDFDPPHTTLHVGTIQGGTALNIVPEFCSFVWEIRDIDDQGDALEKEVYGFIEHINQQLNSSDATCKANVSMTKIDHCPALQYEPNSTAESLVRLLNGDNGLQRVSYMTEAGYYQQEGWPTVICGPGSIDQAHRPDEFVSLEQLIKGQIFMDKLESWLTS